MGETVARTVLYGLIAAASPLTFAATVVILRSSRARVNGALFAGAFLVGGLLVVLVVVTLGSVTAPGPGGSRTAAAVLELALGALLLAAAARMLRGSAAPENSDQSGRARTLLDRLGRITPRAAFPVGALLGIGGPKRLTISVVAATTIAGADLTGKQNLGAAALYVAIASLLVWAPVALYLVTGRRARAWLDLAEAWLLENQRLFAVVSLLVFGVILVTDALVQLS